MRLRESTLAYHGTDPEFTDLKELRIGWFGPTDVKDPVTGDLWWAANRAVEEANERSQFESLRTTNASELSAALPSNVLPFRLISRWAVDPWGTGVSQLTRMVYEEKPLALLGSIDSGATHLAEQVVAKANLPLVSPIATDKTLTLAGVPWMFSCAPSDAAIARALVEDLRKTTDVATPPETASDKSNQLAAAPERQGSCRFALLNCTDHESRMTAREVMKECYRRKIVPAVRMEFQPGAPELERQMNALSELRPKAVVLIAGPDDAAKVIRAMRESVQSLVLGNHALARSRFIELAGAAAEGVRIPVLFDPGTTDTNAVQFIARFSAERGHTPDYAAAMVYDATRLLVTAIRRAGPNPARIRETLGGLSPWPGIAGPIVFDGTGQNSTGDLRIGCIVDGKIVSTGRRETTPKT
jgi:branched-chain amino acid transport system substrate-binding protein